MGAFTPTVALRRLALAGRRAADAVTLHDPDDDAAIREQYDRAVDRDPDLAAAAAHVGELVALTAFTGALREAWRPDVPRLIPARRGRPPLPPEERRVRVAGTVAPSLAEWAASEAAARDAAAAREGQRGRGLSGVIEDALAALRG